MNHAPPIRKILLAVNGLLIGLFIFLVFYYLFIPNRRIVPPEGYGTDRVVIADAWEQGGNGPRFQNGRVLLPYSVIRQYIDPYIWWDEALGKVTVTTRDRVIRMETESLDAMVNGRPMILDVPVSVLDGTVYIPVEVFGDFYGISIRRLQNGGAQTVIIDFPGRETTGLVLKEGVREVLIHTHPSIRAPAIALADADMTGTLQVWEQNGQWVRVRTEQGFFGHIRARYVETVTLPPDKPVTDPEPHKPTPAITGKINMTFEQVGQVPVPVGGIPDMNGLDVLSPTWLVLENATGDLKNRIDTGYLQWAHEHGYRCWALLANDFTNPAMTSAFLNNTDSRENLIRQILATAALYALDGVNIDFENIYLADRDALSQFVRELVPYLHEQGLTVSMDVNVPDGSDTWSKCYDHRALGEVVDYMILMAYDQYYAAGGRAGPVAALDWTETQVLKVLNMAPAKKLVLGVPFYTRVWEVIPDRDPVTAARHAGVIGMETMKILQADYAGQERMDEATGQQMITYNKDGKTRLFWLEDLATLERRAALVRRYDLAGVASWSRSEAVDGVWPLLRQYLKEDGEVKP